MATLTRRRSRSEDAPEESRGRTRRTRPRDDDPTPDESGDIGNYDDDAPRRGRGRSRSEEPDDAPRRGRSRSSKDDGDDEPRGRGRGSRDRDDDSPRRGRRDRDDDKSERGHKRGNKGFGSYREMRTASGGKFADEFKPDGKTLIKILDAEPFDTYKQHWIDDGDAYGKGKRHSYVCRDDKFFEDDEDGMDCPLCEVGDNPSSMSLFNVLNLANPRKPVVEVWRCTVTVADKLERASEDRKTSPLNREDLYWEVEQVKTRNKTTWDIQPVKERDLEEDFDVEPLSEDEITDFEKEGFLDRSAVIQVDSYADLADLADSL